MGKELDKKTDQEDDKVEDKVEDKLDLNDPVTFITALVEKNKDDEDFIVGATNVINQLKGNVAKDLEKENAKLKEDLAKSKRRFYDTFMGKVSEDEPVDEINEEIETTVTVNDLLQKLERK